MPPAKFRLWRSRPSRRGAGALRPSFARGLCVRAQQVCAAARSKRLATVAAIAFAPKCLFCVLTYAGLLGSAGIEFCGGSPTGPDWTLRWAILTVAAGLILHITLRPAVR